jgi:hypothetical protein
MVSSSKHSDSGRFSGVFRSLSTACQRCVAAGALGCAVVVPPIPVDLDARVDLQAVIDREPGQYLGHVSTVAWNDGKTILAAYPKGHGKGPIVLRRSDDGGLTWSGRLPVPGNWATSGETPTLYRVLDPATGKPRILLFSGLKPARIARSDDDGATWTPLEPIGAWGGIVLMGDLLQRRDGSIAAFFHDDGRFFGPEPVRDAGFTLYSVESRDGGLTWAEPKAFWSGKDVHLCEPGLVASPDGKRLAMLLRENRRVQQSHVMFSDDEGRTWSTPREVDSALTGDRHVARYLPDGRLVISFRDTAADSPTKGDWVAWIGSWDDVANGGPGQFRVRLKDNRNAWDCAYPGVTVLPDGTIVAITYGHWTEGEPPWILGVRFTVADLKSRDSHPFPQK